MSNGVPTFVCTFLAHVDHGKTTLCDLLLSQYHSTLSSSQVGEARLLDSSDEEVRRGITIKQGYMVIEANVPKEGGGEERVVMGVMDSPGHVDFQSEVSDSLLLSSFGLLLVDVAEGVLCRTVGVLRVLGSKGALVFVNKMDRIKPDEWEIRARRIVEDVNAVRCRTAAAEGGEGGGESMGRVKGIEVIIGSAKEGWGCSLVGLATVIMGHVKPGSNTKEGRKLARMIFEGKMGARFDFENGGVKVVKNRDSGKAEGWNMVSEIYAHCDDLAAEFNFVHADKSSSAVLALSKSRFPYFFPPSSSPWCERWVLRFSRCKAWKGGSVMQLLCPLGREVVEGTRVEGTGTNRRLVTVGKVHGGDIVKGGKWALLKPDGRTCKDCVTISRLTVVHGGVKHKDVEEVEEGGIIMVSARGPTVWDEGWMKDGAVLSYGTLVRRKDDEGGWKPGVDDWGKVNKMPSRGTRAITFTVAPKEEADRKPFDRGIELVRLLEPGAVVNTTDRGEVAISVGGEVEMENLVHDMKAQYMEGVEVKVGERLVEGREGVSWREGSDKTYSVSTKLCEDGEDYEKLKQLLEDDAVGALEIPLFKDMREGLLGQGHVVIDGHAKIKYEEGNILLGVYPMPEEVDCEGDEEERAVEEATGAKMWMRTGSNFLLCSSTSDKVHALRPVVTSAFNAFVKAGPVMEEPMHAVIVIVHDVQGVNSDSPNSLPPPPSSAPSTTDGQRVGTLFQAMRACCLSLRTVVYEPYCMCEFQSTLSSSSHAYACISKRRGKVRSEDMLEGTDLIGIKAVIPMADMGGITRELLERSSGEATAPIVEFDHWGECEGDPFWRPKEEEEREEHGEGQAMGDNISGKQVRRTRKRKGLRAVYEEEKIVVEAEKLRNLKTKK
ncbi:hypothetical protein TrRE_jg3188 [Triparma retinervis]|uniref:Tr-type G domain-containing protein n=1 Tax=Triparma retinervis TaxID=2557542 RepID=A0A9W7EGR6_9STRA|nr:hypothetical protein TrRE_jg3188 [Triparma retinervis]